jgi:hypothetical protein
MNESTFLEKNNKSSRNQTKQNKTKQNKIKQLLQIAEMFI